MTNIKYIRNSNCLIISNTCGILSFQSFKTIQFIINYNKKLYKKVYFKKIPQPNHTILIKPTDTILEFIIFNNILDILKLIKSLTYKVAFKFKVIYLKKHENTNRT